MDYRIGHFVVAIGHTFGWIAVLAAVFWFGRGFLHQSGAEAMIGLYLFVTAIFALIFATIGSAVLVTAEGTEKLAAAAAEAERKARG